MDHNQEEIDEVDDLDGIKSRLAGGRASRIPHEAAHGGSPMTMGEIVAAEGGMPQDAPPAKKQRKPRSDAGKPRPVKPVSPVAALDDDGAKKKHLALVEKVHQARAKMMAAREAFDHAVAELNAHVDTL